MADGLQVRGGRYGITARLDQMVAVGSALGPVGRGVGEQALELHAVLLDPAVLAAAVWDPPGAARFGLDLLAALEGPSGMTGLAAQCLATEAALRAAAAAYARADRLGAEYVPAASGLIGLPRAEVAAVVRGGSARDAVRAAGAVDPELVDSTLDLITRFWTRGGLLTTAAHYPDGRPAVADNGVDVDGPAAIPPRGVGDLFSELARRNEGPGGRIDVRIVTGTDAAGRPTRHVIVDLPGTKTWAPYSGDVTSLGTNIRSTLGAETTYERGVVIALQRAGVRPDDPILLVGHSQGGIVAADTARHLAGSGRYDVRGVITAGAPIGRLPIPASVTVLALENAGDVIPHCDGTSNPDRPNVTTVTVPARTNDAAANHALSTGYAAGATAVDESHDPSIGAAVGELGGFLDGTAVRTQVFTVSRQ